LAQKQKGPCAFTAACTVPGPRVALAGTNRTFCGFHARQIEATLMGVEQHGSEFARADYRGGTSRRRRSSWATYNGVTETF
jgi:hypothetical protein